MKNRIVIIWSEGFPYKKSASNEKNFLIAKALWSEGNRVIITSKLPLQSSFIKQGVFEEIEFINFGRPKIKNKFINYFFSILKEALYFISLRKETKSDIALISSYTNFFVFTFYSLVCKLLGIRIILSIMEWHISLNLSSFFAKINAILFDRLAIRFSYGAVAISNQIIENLKKYSRKSKYYLLPSITDVEKIDRVIPNPTNPTPYFLYCGGIGYMEVINLIIDSFTRFRQREESDVNLILVLNGNQNQIDDLKTKIEESKYRVLIFTNLEYKKLIELYKGASILLIPLRNTMQDMARYPQKISEYAACGKPIISNNVGQVGLDFKHLENIYFIDEYSIDSLAEGMSVVFRNEDLQLNLSKEVRLFAESYFDYNVYSNTLNGFIFKN